MNAKSGPARKVNFYCSLCDYENSVDVAFGCFVLMVNGSTAEIMEERPGQTDRWISDVWCPKCGCTKYLTMVEPPKKEKTPDENN